MASSEKLKTYYSNSRPEVQALVPQICKRLLDVGCGKAAFSKALQAQRSIEIWGIEPVKDAADEAAKHLHTVLQMPVETSLEKLPENYFDCIVCNDVLEHLIDPAYVIRQLRNRLTNDGMFIASIPNFRYFENLWEIVVKKEWKYKTEGILDATHLRFFTKQSIIRLFSENTYTITHIEGINPISSKQKWFKRLNLFFPKLLEDTKYLQFVIIAKKND